MISSRETFVYRRSFPPRSIQTFAVSGLPESYSMKSCKTVLRTIFLLAVIFVAANANVFAKKPFIIKLVEKPTALHVGQTYTFAFEVQNISDDVVYFFKT